MRHTILALGVAGLLAVGGPASADTLGQTTGSVVVCGPLVTVPAAVVLATQAPGTATYTAATSGVITSFSHRANGAAGGVRAVVLTPATAGGTRSVAAKSPVFPVTVNAVNTFATRLPIAAGQSLALGFTAVNMACALQVAPTDSTQVDTAFDPDTSATFTPAGTLSPATPRPNISAVLEPDVDRDGYGDTTQDACPQSALSQVACPVPDTTITKKPKRTRANAKVKVKFTSTVAGSTFECSLDGRKFRPCTSPYTKKLGRGSHALRIRAVSPAGLVDPQPAKVKVRITGY
ncbi:hypothetical protein G5V58_22590 [Nocardioides anomalus]|uniref:Ig-like domain repeat protein n=1 Tax=Nocardioides anomalus TaxID=2712223 RepID=A0A6G6WIX8_9ACTN|nr:hypothetical protein [Nocardioides anomalus]QIG45179.1 hypothetical protein G5V58_22590 [Nocardioides anomalus]